MLDHHYFLSEIEVILATVDSLFAALFQQRINNSGTPPEQKILSFIKTKLMSVQEYFKSLPHFDPKEYLKIIEDAHKGLELVKSHKRMAQETYLDLVPSYTNIAQYGV
jgi:hypothetical protein